MEAEAGYILSLDYTRFILICYPHNPLCDHLLYKLERFEVFWENLKVVFDDEIWMEANVDSIKLNKFFPYKSIQTAAKKVESFDSL